MDRAGIGRQIENQFECDLYCLNQKGSIRAYWKSKWHGVLDKQGVDAIITRTDGVEIKIDVTTKRGVGAARRLNKKLVKRGLLNRRGIMVWGHELNSQNSEERRELLLKAINDFKTD